MTKKIIKQANRPNRIELDLDTAKKLAYMQCTEAEIASILGCSPRTLRRSKEFMEIYAAGKEHGKSSLRRLQWEKAKGRDAVFVKDEQDKIIKDEKGRPIVQTPGYAPDTVMQIWLGKQYLEQRDKREETHSGELGIKIISGVPRPNPDNSIRTIPPIDTSTHDISLLNTTPTIDIPETLEAQGDTRGDMQGDTSQPPALP